MKNSRFIIATVLLSACTPMMHAHEDVLRPLQSKNETWSKIGIGAGIVLTLMGVAVLAKGDKKFTKRAITLSVGGLIVAGGCEVERRWSAEELAQKQVHRTEVTKMEEKWEHNFAALQKVADK